MRIVIGIFLALIANEAQLFAAEAGMPQLDPKYWASQAFWLISIFSLLYLSLSKIFIPKIKNSLDNRNDKIKSDLEEARKFSETSEIKQKDYELIIENAKKDVQKILIENKEKLTLDIQSKKKKFEKEIEKEIEIVKIEITRLKKGSISEIQSISKEIASEVIKEISGDKLNDSSVNAAIVEISKKHLENY